MQPALMHASSRESLKLLRAEVDEAVDGLPAAEAGGLSDELFEVAEVLDREVTLRRLLSDSSSEPQRRADLAEELFGSRISASALRLVSAAVRAKWSFASDLVDALIDAARQVALAVAEADGTLDTVEEELFRFGRILDANSDLHSLLSDVSTPNEQKLNLLESLIAGKVTPTTERLLRQVVVAPRSRHVETAIQELSELAARRRERSIAYVKSARPLSTTQESRLVTALTSIYNRPISVRLDVDPDVLGGLRVTVGDEVVDGSIAHRLDEVRRRLAG